MTVRATLARYAAYFAGQERALPVGVASLPAGSRVLVGDPHRTKGDDEGQWRAEAALGFAWRFGWDDMPHFVHRNRRWWLVRDEAGRWEAWLGHRPVGRFASPREAKFALLDIARHP